MESPAVLSGCGAFGRSGTIPPARIHAAGTASSSFLRNVLTLVALIAAAAILSSYAWIFDGDVVFNSDGLLPVAWMHDAINFPATLGQFQLARIPSLFPDLAFFALFTSVASDFRWALFGYSVFQCAAALILSSIIVARVIGRDFPASGAAVAIVFCAAVVLGSYQPYLTFHSVFRLFEHFGSFVMTLLSVVLLLRVLDRPRSLRWILLFVVCAAAAASNKIFLLTFDLPACVVAGVMWRRGEIPRSLAIGVAGCAAASFLIGIGAASLLPLEQAPRISRLLVHVREFVLQFGAHICRFPLPYLALSAAPLAIFLYYPRWRNRFRPARPVADAVWIVAAVGIGLVTLFCVALFEDVASIRYLTAAFFWPLIFVAAWIADAFSRPRARIGLALTSIVLGGGVAAISAAKAGEFKRWENPLATCLVNNREAWRLRDGLADYWLARPAVIASGWTLQIEQTLHAKYYRWGNNLYWLTHSRANRNQPPSFNFVVPSAETTPQEIRAAYGNPARIESCAGHPVWIYDAPLHVVGIIDPWHRTRKRSGLIAGLHPFLSP